MPYRSTRSKARSARSLDTTCVTDQNGRQTANLDSIVAQYRKNGTMPALTPHDGLYGDFTGPDDLHDQYEAVNAAEDRFGRLPSNVRKACDHNPEVLLAKLQDPVALNELMDEGLVLLDEAGEIVPRPELPSTAASDAPASDSDIAAGDPAAETAGPS